MPPAQTNGHQNAPNIFTQSGEKINENLAYKETKGRFGRRGHEGAAVKNPRELLLEQRTKDYIDRFREILYEHDGAGNVKQDAQTGQYQEKNDLAVREKLVAAADPESGTYNPYEAAICADILVTRNQKRVERTRDQNGHRQELARALQTFRQTDQESQILFGHLVGRRQYLKALDRANPQDPDLEALQTAQSIWQQLEKRQDKNPVAQLKTTRLDQGGGWHKTIELLKELKTQYAAVANAKHENILDLDAALSQMKNDNPAYQSTAEALQKVREEYNEINDFIGSVYNGAQQPSLKEQLAGFYLTQETYQVTDKKGNTQTKTREIQNLQAMQALKQAQEVALKFLEDRQARVFAQQRDAYTLLSANEISGVNNLQEIARIKSQYGEFDQKWMMEMGGDTKELQRRIEQWGGLKIREGQVQQEIKKEEKWLGGFAELVGGFSLADLQEMKEKVQTFTEICKLLGISKEEARAMLGLPAESKARAEAQKGKERLTIEVGSASLANPEHKDKNEDAVFVNKALGLALLFEGVGGAAAGDIASRLAIETISQALLKISAEASPEQILEAMLEAMAQTHEKILQEAQTDIQKSDMGTTASVVKIWTGPSGERKLIFATTGNGRVYIRHKDGTLEQVSTDDFVLPPNIDQAADLSTLSDKQKNLFSLRSLVRRPLGGTLRGKSINKDELTTEVRKTAGIVDLQEGDEIIVTSNGIHDNLTRQRMQQVLEQNKNKSPQEAAQALAQEAQLLSQFKPLTEPPSFLRVVLNFAKQDVKNHYLEDIDPMSRAYAIQNEMGLAGLNFFNARRLSEILEQAATTNPDKFAYDLGLPEAQEAIAEIMPGIIKPEFFFLRTEFLAASPQEQTNMFLQELGLENNPLVNKVKLQEVLTTAAAADLHKFNDDLGQPEISAALREIFPLMDRAKPDDISAIVLEPKRETARPARAAVINEDEEENEAAILGPEGYKWLLNLLPTLQTRRGEKPQDMIKRVQESFREGGDNYEYLAQALGEEAANGLSERIDHYTRRQGLFAAFLAGLLANFGTSA